MFEYEDQGELGQVRTRAVVVRDRIILTGDDVNDASVAMNQYNEPYVALEFKPRGGKVFCDITSENVGRRFAIVLDNKARSAPVIREAICGGRASIEMGVQDYNQGLKEASVLALVLRTGALPAPVSIGDVRTVGASLGADAIAAGKLATSVGGVLVLFFMLLFYKKAGVVSCIALITNILLVMLLLAAAGATLTLPGIAGIALTVGMAVDCNIIVYERIREELRLGKNTRSAVDSGFSNALTAVLDANITTFIAGVVLYTYGTGPIKGFSVTLMIGIITTLFTGIFVSRTMMDFVTRKASSRLSI
jgi:preprotein translocase subunit SecD